MGLLVNLLALPVTGPIKFVTWVAEQVAEQAERELYNADKVRGKLMELELLYDMGEISEEDYLEAEEILLERLRMIQERQQADGRP